jgi:hypothetical protein
MTVVGTLVAGGFVASPAVASIPTTFSPIQAAAVPGSNASYVLGETLSATKTATAVAHYGAGKPSVSIVHTGAVISAIAAGSKSAVWLGGSEYANAAYSAVILKRSGSKWSSVKLPALGTDPSIKAMAASSANNAWAVGELPSTNGINEDVLHWNGKSWTAVNTGEPTGTQFTAVSTSSPDNAWAIAQTGLVHWNGKTWSISKGTFTGSLQAITTSSANRAWAVGVQTTSSDRSVAYSVRFTGKKWVSVKTPKFYLSQLLGVSMHGTSVWAVGTYQKSRTSTSQLPYLLHATGSSWHQVSVPKDGNGGQLQTISAGSSSSATAMGRYYTGKLCQTKTHFLVISVHGSKAKRASARAIDGMAATPDVSSIPDC